MSVITAPHIDYELPLAEWEGGKDGLETEAAAATASLVPMQWSELLLHFDFDRKSNTLTPRRRVEPDFIIPGLYLGDQRNAYSPETLEKYKIKGVLSVTIIPDMSAHKSRFSPSIELETIQVSDERTSNISQHFPRAISFIDKIRNRGQSVLVHCVWGMSRSSTIVTAYLMYKLNLSLSAALQFVRDARPIAAPNDGFTTQLAEYGRRLSGVSFSVHFDTAWGENLHLVGSCEALGKWKWSSATKMKWVGGGWWKIEVPLWGTNFEYKYVVVKETAQGTPATKWESCPNRHFDGSRRFVRDNWDAVPPVPPTSRPSAATAC
ncbi:dual specificity protein phosphatase [Pelomyxa schiedti]|nr:dual specificity protein phosphatase [Pelomyxa schiedti]